MTSDNDDETEWERGWEELDLLEETEAEALQIAQAKFTWMKPLQDFAVGSNLYQWFRLEYRGGDRLVMKHCGKGEIVGTLPDWHDEGEDTLDQLDMGYEEAAYTAFAIAYGLSPGQPFLVEFRPPVGYRSSYEYDEWDVDYHWTVIRSMPKAPASAGKSWERALKGIAAYKASLARRKRHWARLRLALKHRWVLTQTFHRDISYPRVDMALQVSIKGDHCATLAQGSSDSYNKEKPDASLAFSRLLADFEKRHPEEDTKFVVDLGLTTALKEPIRLSAWKRLLHDVSFI